MSRLQWSGRRASRAAVRRPHGRPPAPAPPRRDNGLGAITDLEYTTSADEYLRDLRDADGGAAEPFTWSHVDATYECPDVLRESPSDTECYKSGGSPVVSSVVHAVQTSDRMSELGRLENTVRTEYAYHDGYLSSDTEKRIFLARVPKI